MVIFDGKIFLYLIKHGKINSVSQYFPNDQSMMLQNLKLLKVCLKYQLGQILQLTFKKLSLKKKKETITDQVLVQYQRRATIIRKDEKNSSFYYLSV